MNIWNFLYGFSFQVFLCAFSINYVLIYSQSAEQSNNTICSNPQKDLDFDAVWVHDNAPPDGWRILYGNPVARLHFAQLLQGRELDDDEDLSQLCLKTVYDNTDTDIGGHYEGYGNLTARRSCSLVGTGAGDKVICELTSSSNTSYTEKVSGYASYVDKKDFRSYHIGVACYENGDIGWVINSIKKNLTDEDITTAFKHLESIGFNPEDQVQLFTDSCEE